MMINKIIAKLSKFGAVGITATITHISIFTLLRNFFSLEEQLSNFIAFLFAFSFSWCGHYFWTFQSGGKQSIFFFAIVAVIGYSLNSFWIWLAITNYDLADYYAIALMVLITPLITFTLSNFWAFRNG